MSEEHDPKHLDKRTAERYLRMGVLDEKSYERHIKGLPDVSDKARDVETLMLDDDFDDEMDDDEDDDEQADGLDELPEEPGA